jgi:hypothetical protein
MLDIQPVYVLVRLTAQQILYITVVGSGRHKPGIQSVYELVRLTNQ